MAKADGFNGVIVKVVLGAFVAATATLTGVFAHSMVDEQRHVELKQSEHGERLSSLEAFNEGIRDDLRRMNDKLDQILILERVTR